MSGITSLFRLTGGGLPRAAVGREDAGYVKTFARVTFGPAVLISVLAASLLSGCTGEATAQAGAPGQGQAMPVPVVKVQKTDLPLSWEYPAQVSGYREVEIRARVSGIIEKRGFEEGSRVRKGQSLFALDSVPYETALTRALAEQKTAEIRAAQTTRDLERIKPLLATKAVSQLEFDTARDAMELAQANLLVARARVQEAQLNVSYAKVESPVDGFVSRSLKDEGSLVSGPQELLTTVTQIDKVYVNFGIPQKDHENMGGQNVKIQGNRLRVDVLNADGNSAGISADLAFQDVRINPATGTVDARSLVANKGEKLSPGQFVRVRLTGAVQEGAITLPQRAVLQSPMGGKVVMTVSPESTVEPRPVQVAQWSGDQWVITSGLNDGDLVLTDGYIKAQPGTPVKPMIQGEQSAQVSRADQAAMADSQSQGNASAAGQNPAKQAQ